MAAALRRGSHRPLLHPPPTGRVHPQTRPAHLAPQRGGLRLALSATVWEPDNGPGPNLVTPHFPDGIQGDWSPPSPGISVQTDQGVGEPLVSSLKRGVLYSPFRSLFSFVLVHLAPPHPRCTNAQIALGS